VREQRVLDLETPRESGQRAAGAHQAVAGQDDRQRVARVRGADRAGRARPPEPLGLRTVAARRPVRDRGQFQPRAALEGGPGEVERQLEGGARAGEVLAELRGGGREDRMDPRLRGGGRRLAGPQHAPQARVTGHEGEPAHRGVARRQPHAPAAHRWCAA